MASTGAIGTYRVSAVCATLQSYPGGPPACTDTADDA